MSAKHKSRGPHLLRYTDTNVSLISVIYVTRALVLFIEGTRL
jgi:hypothetical protein